MLVDRAVQTCDKAPYCAKQNRERIPKRFRAAGAVVTATLELCAPKPQESLRSHLALASSSA